MKTPQVPALEGMTPLGMTAAKQAQRTPGPWYEAKTGNHQGLVISEQTGANIAVTYDATDAAFIVRACNSHDDLTARVAKLETALRYIQTRSLDKLATDRATSALVEAAKEVAREALAKAEA